MDEEGIGSAVEQIIDVATKAAEARSANANAVRTIDGETYTGEDFKHLPKADHAPEILGLSTLRALVNYIKGDPDVKFTTGRKPFVIVNSPSCVSFGFGADGPYLRRRFVAKSDAPLPSYSWGSAMEVERFLINIRSMFVGSQDVNTLVALFSKIDATNAVKLADDGMSQQIAVSRGVRGAEGVQLQPTYSLQPFRTFPEVTQPVSPFIVRLQGGDPTRSQLPTVSIHEADLGQWKLAAVASVKEWLKGELPVGTLILG